MKRVINYLFVLAAMSCSLTSCNSSDDDLGNESIVPPQETVTITDTRKSIATEMLTIPYHELAFLPLEIQRNLVWSSIFMVEPAVVMIMKSRWRKLVLILYPIT